MTTDIIEATLSETRAPAVERALQAVDTSPSALLRLAVQSGASLDQLERFMALQERHEATEARKACVMALTQFKAEPLTIYKTKEVAFNDTRYKHAELSDVTAVVVPAMAKHGLSHRWTVEQRDGKIVVTCVITHALGHSESVTMEAAPDASGKKNAIQAVASTTTYLQRYTLLAATGMATTGQDDDGHGGGMSEADVAKQAAMDKRGAELREMTADMTALFTEGREMDVLAIWRNPKHWDEDQGIANEERMYAWSELKKDSKLRTFLQANDRKENTK